MIHFIDTEEKLTTQLYPWLETKKNDLIGFDTETTGLRPLYSELLLIQFGDFYNQYVLDVYTLNVLSPKLIQGVFKFINDNNIALIAHNAKFDYKFILHFYKIEIKYVFCTQIASQLLSMGMSSQIRHDLKTTLERYLSKSMDKEIRATFEGHKYGQGFTTDQIEYAALDTKYLIHLRRELMKHIKKENLLDILRLELETLPIIAKMELHGVKIDTQKWGEAEQEAIKNRDKAKIFLDTFFIKYVGVDLFGEATINYKSPVQLKPILEKITGTKIESTAEKELKMIDHPVIHALFDYRKAVKLVTTYGKEFIKKHLDYDSRIRSNFKQLGTVTGRIASDDPNLQNIPSKEEYRSPFISDTGYKFLSADYSGQELRLLAQLSQEPVMLEAFKNGMDMHAYSASLLFKIPYKDFFELDSKGNILYEGDEPVFKKEMKKKYRNPAKSITFGLIYGLSKYGLARNLKISIEEAEELINKYFNIFTKVRDLMQHLVAELHKNKYAYSPLDGRKLFFYDLDWHNKRKVAHAERQAQNFPFQGSGASTTKLALIYLDRAITEQNIDAKILFSVHDEINIEVSEKDSNRMVEIVKKEMTRAFNYFAPDVPMVISAQLSDHWIH